MNGSREKRSRRFRIGFFVTASVLTVLLILFAVGLARDYGSFDNTQGGYEPPYTDFTGQPIDWERTDVTPQGFAYRGYVVNFLVNCTTGVLSFEIYKQEIDWRTFSPRALIVHKPKEACIRQGFAPKF